MSKEAKKFVTVYIEDEDSVIYSVSFMATNKDIADTIGKISNVSSRSSNDEPVYPAIVPEGFETI